jgi:hypothetical protein
MDRFVGAYGCSFRLVGGPASGTLTGLPISSRGASSSDSITVSLLTSGNLEFRYRNSLSTNVTVVTTGGLIVPNTWFSFVARWDHPGQRRRIELYDDAGVLLNFNENTVTAFDAPLEITGVTFGKNTSTVQEAYVDNCFIGDTYDEPIQNNFHIVEFGDYVGAGGGADIDGGMAATEARDVLASAGAKAYSGVVGATEARDTFAASGMAIKEIDGNLAATEFFDDATFLPVEEDVVANTIAARDGNFGIGISPETHWRDGPPTWERGVVISQDVGKYLPTAIGQPPSQDNFTNNATDRQMRLVQALGNTPAGMDILPGWFSYVDVVANEWVWAVNRNLPVSDSDNPIGDENIP